MRFKTSNEFLNAFRMEQLRFMQKTGHQPSCMFVSRDILNEFSMNLDSEETVFITLKIPDLETGIPKCEIQGIQTYQVMESGIIKAAL